MMQLSCEYHAQYDLESFVNHNMKGGMLQKQSEEYLGGQAKLVSNKITRLPSLAI